MWYGIQPNSTIAQIETDRVMKENSKRNKYKVVRKVVSVLYIAFSVLYFKFRSAEHIISIM